MNRLVLLVSAVLVLGVAPAQATEQARASAQVQYADLDLSRSDDVAVLLARLGRASVRACEPEASYRPSAAERRAVRECRQEALAQAVARVNEPALTQLYQQRRGPTRLASR